MSPREVSEFVGNHGSGLVRLKGEEERESQEERVFVPTEYAQAGPLDGRCVQLLIDSDLVDPWGF